MAKRNKQDKYNKRKEKRVRKKWIKKLIIFTLVISFISAVLFCDYLYLKKNEDHIWEYVRTSLNLQGSCNNYYLINMNHTTQQGI